MRAFIIASVILVGLMSSARPARADLGSSVYDDVRDVIEQLIQEEITTSVVATIDARAPLVGAYFKGTLERLASPAWSGLSAALREDLTEVAGDFVYWHLSTTGLDGDIVASARRFFHCAIATGGDGCDRLREIVVVQGRTLVDAECRRVEPPPERRVACDLGQATRAALEQRGEARRHVLDAIADLLLAQLGDAAVGARLREVLLGWLDDPNATPAVLTDLVASPEVLTFLDSEALPALCRDKVALRAYFEDPTSTPGWACFAISAKELPETLALGVQVDQGGTSAKTTIQFWRLGGILAAVGDDAWGDHALYTALAEAAAPDVTLTTGATVTVTWLDVTMTGKLGTSNKIRGNEPKELARWMKRFARVNTQIEALRAAMPPVLATLLFVADSGRDDGQAILASVARMARLAAALKTRWYLLGGEGQDLASLDIVALLELTGTVLVDAGKELSRDAGVLARISGGEARELGDWLRLVVRGDQRALASELLRAGLELADQRADRPHETFFVALVAYLLDTDGGGEDVTRGAFRAAAKELLSSVRDAGVPTADHRFSFGWLPRIGVRAAFSEAYAVEPGDQSRRYVVAADWPTVMLAFDDHVGVEASVLDPVAPLAELAMRAPGDYADQKLVALDAVRPRLGLWLAAPELSSRLALSLGVGARLVGLERESADGEALEAKYVRKTSLTLDLGIELVF